jgi:hypothetical protein
VAWTCRPCQRGDCVDTPDACMNPSLCVCCRADVQPERRAVTGPAKTAEG